MKFIRATFAALLLALVCAVPAGAEGGAPVIQFSDGRWFNGEGFERSTWYSVEGRLTQRRPARIDVRVDLAGRYVLPPFAEAHNHDMQNAFLGAMSARRYLGAGVFYTAQMCAQPEQVASFRGFVGQPNTVDVLFTAACVSASDGHPLGIALRMDRQAGYETTAADYHDRGYLVVDTLADLDAKWPRIAEAPSRLVKLILVNSEDYAANRQRPELYGFNGLDPTLVPVIVERAHAAGMRVAAHVDTAYDFRVAVEAGADIIAHLPGYRFTSDKSAADYRIDDDAIAEAARRWTTVITTAVAARHFMRRQPELADAVRETQIDNLRRLIAAGVPLATGSDLVGDGSVLDELEYLDGLGVMPRAALLRLATEATPRLLFPERSIGAFAEGAEASLIALDANPLVDLAAIRRVSLRVKQGNLLASLAE
jgi:hypothetical protein